MRSRKRQNNNIVTVTDDDQQSEDHEILKDIEDEEEARTEAPSPNKKKAKGASKRKTTSVHWKDYDKVMVKEGNPPVKRMKAQCKRCGKLIAADSRGCGTNGLKNHTISCLKNNTEVGDGQTILAYSVDGGSRGLTTWKFDQKTIRLGLCKMILLDELPFLFVEREDRILHKKIINFFKIDSYKGDDIGAAIVKSLTDWGLNHLFSCTLDNASQNDTAIDVVQTHMELNNIDILGGKYFHVRCASHVLNLIVKDNLKEIVISIRRVTKKPTSHLFFTEMCGIFDLIRRLEMSSDYDVSSMASRMRLKIGKYWLDETELNVKMNKILYMVVVLDLRQKMKHVETCLKLLYGNARGLEMVKEVRDSMRELFVFYSARYAPRPPSRSSVDANKENSSCEEDTYSMFAMSDDDEDSSNQTELDIYLTDMRHKVPREEMRSFDLLKWWIDAMAPTSNVHGARVKHALDEE
ncbi:hypothetical protein SASPL_142790 [Salvia splendens]|uniref:hAT-like transposase RNase-H fold domain-containing protein n=1 Tax=Salvia splendens TaxID=180675 RepID=A0A8X8WLB6_SALSN|nr:hypothetical protein SASPL_142790 [Salvia splendens]